MKLEIECSTPEQAYAAIAAGDVPVLTGDIRISVSTSCKIVCRGSRESSQPHVEARGSSQPHVVARESSQPHVEAWGSSQPHVVAWGSSQPHVVARESSQPHVVAWGSSQPHVVARESSQPHVEASGHCQVSVRGKVKVKATAMVAVLAMGLLAEIEGGGFVNRVNVTSAQEWCEYYGVEIQGDCAVLFKGLDSEFRAKQNRFLYQPGESQRDPLWDPNPERECGGGLHFSPSPRHTLKFAAGAKKFVAVLVPLSTILVHWGGEFPEKVRAPETRGCWEVDINGKRIAAAPAGLSAGEQD